MKDLEKFIFAIFSIAILSVPVMVNAALFSRLGGLAYYDDVADLTWLADANAARTSGYDANGLMTLDDATTWVAGLSVAGVDGWRLPSTLQNDNSCSYQYGPEAFGYNCTGSELGNLFYNVLGGSASFSITTNHNANYNLFSNVQSYYYWSATEFVPITRYEWNFSTTNGYQKINSKGYSFYSWPVQTGDINNK